jgi:GMP synthase (glutamine-hydrolysing)
VLGLCLGAQMLAAALGAPTPRLAQAEIGWSEIALAPQAADDPVLGGLPGTFPAFEWHDYVFDLPAGAELLGGSAQAPHQAVRLAEHAWALQFHIEVGAATIHRWTAESTGELTEKGVDAEVLLAETALNAPAYVERARALGERFLVVAERRAALARALS